MATLLLLILLVLTFTALGRASPIPTRSASLTALVVTGLRELQRLHDLRWPPRT